MPPQILPATSTPPRAQRRPVLPRTVSLSDDEFDDLAPAVTLDLAILLLVGTALGAAVAAVAVPRLLPDLTASLLGDQPKVYWYVSRSSGVVAYVALWLSAVLGLTITNHLARLWPGGPTALDLHQFSALLALSLVAIHVIVLLGDRFTNYRVLDLVVPFMAVEHEPFWVGLGQIATYIALPVTFSFYVRRQIGTRTWRLLHFGSFAVLVLVIAHGLGAGTDSRGPALLGLYLTTSGALVFLTTYRVLMTMARRSRPLPQQRP